MSEKIDDVIRFLERRRMEIREEQLRARSGQLQPPQAQAGLTRKKLAYAWSLAKDIAQSAAQDQYRNQGPVSAYWQRMNPGGMMSPRAARQPQQPRQQQRRRPIQYRRQPQRRRWYKRR